MYQFSRFSSITNYQAGELAKKEGDCVVSLLVSKRINFDYRRFCCFDCCLAPVGIPDPLTRFITFCFFFLPAFFLFNKGMKRSFFKGPRMLAMREMQKGITSHKEILVGVIKKYLHLLWNYFGFLTKLRRIPTTSI